jgi:hypothetical protein
MRKSKNQVKARKGQSSMRANNLYVINIGMCDMIVFLDPRYNPARLTYIWMRISVASVGIVMLVQLRLSLPDESSAEFWDKLESYKRYKRQVTLGRHGRTLAITAGLTATAPYILAANTNVSDDEVMETVLDVEESYIANPIPNTRRFPKPSGNTDWKPFLEGEISAATGQILSCPATNIKMLNLNASEVKDMSVEQALEAVGLSKDFRETSGLSTELIKGELKTLLLESDGGIPFKELSFKENPLVSSVIEKEILGDQVKRTGYVATSLYKGQEPGSAITRTIATKYLSRLEMFAYDVASRNGDPNILRKYTKLICDRIEAENLQAEAAKAKPQAVQTPEQPEAAPDAVTIPVEPVKATRRRKAAPEQDATNLTE